MKRFWKWLVGDKWVVRRTIWPYKDGYGVYNPYRKTIVETGMKRESAQSICDQMNAADDAAKVIPK